MFPIITHPTGQDDRSHNPMNRSFLSSPHKRSRRWERQHQDEKVVYRGVDSKLVRSVKALSTKLRVPQGQVARAILEYALRRYEDGFMDLHPRPNPMRMRNTLFPSPTHSRRINMKQKSKIRKQPNTSWRNITTWRNFSPELKRTLSALASEEALNVPVGELVTALLRYGLQAHQAGFLNLEPTEKATVLTLLGEGEA
jgi:hypothetical protein